MSKLGAILWWAGALLIWHCGCASKRWRVGEIEAIAAKAETASERRESAAADTKTVARGKGKARVTKPNGEVWDLEWLTDVATEHVARFEADEKAAGKSEINATRNKVDEGEQAPAGMPWQWKVALAALSLMMVIAGVWVARRIVRMGLP